MSTRQGGGTEEGTLRFCLKGDSHDDPIGPGGPEIPGDGERAIHGDTTTDNKVQTMVNIEVVVERFKVNTRLRLKASVQKQYISKFRVFAKRANLQAYSPQQLAGAKGKALLMDYLEPIPKPSWRNTVNLIKGVWTYGTTIPFPLDLKRDLGKLPHTQRGMTPGDDVIKAWNEAMKHEPDTYTKLRWHLFGMGLRPSHVARLKWRNIQYTNGKPTAIYADGSKEDFKTRSPVAIRLNPQLIDLITKWSKESPDTYPEHFILPCRMLNGDIVAGRELGIQQAFNLWTQAKNKWKLPQLRPRDVRHWVSTISRKHGLSKQATAYMQGHDSAAGGQMRDYYDNPELQDIYDEQGAVFPNGPLGTLDPLEIKIIEGIPDDVLDLVRDYMDGKTGTMQFATSMEVARSRQNKPLNPELLTK